MGLISRDAARSASATAMPGYKCPPVPPPARNIVFDSLINLSSPRNSCKHRHPETYSSRDLESRKPVESRDPSRDTARDDTLGCRCSTSYSLHRQIPPDRIDQQA